MGKVRDSQRQRLYNWEDAVVRSADSTQPVVKKTLRRSTRPHPTQALVTIDGRVYRSLREYGIKHGYPVQDYFASRIETKVIGGLTLPQAQEFVDRVCKAYGIRRSPQVVFGGRTWARAKRAERITLPAWSRSFAVTAHEVAHAVISDWRPGITTVKGWNVAAHGPEFLAVFIDILAKFLFYDRVELRNSARAAGLEVADKAYPLPVGQ